MFDLEEELKKLPDNPGVYLMHDNMDNIIYVGKAVNLKNRVQPVFSGRQKCISRKIERMISQIAVLNTFLQFEVEALVLECNLIKEYSPEVQYDA